MSDQFWTDMPAKKPEMFERPGRMLRISLQRFAQFATGRIRRGGHDSAIYDHNE